MHKPNKKLDVVIVEASAITEEGGIIPGASVGASPELIQMADKVCIRIRDAEVAKNNNYRVDHHRS
jgi:acetyl-CoA hydrolase